MEQERWRPIPSFEGYYEVSDQGRVRSLTRTIKHHPDEGGQRTIQGKILSTPQDPWGRPVVNLCRGNNKKQWKVHHLVLLAFDRPRPEGMECCHNNGNAADNRLENLRWDTHSENNYDRTRHRTHPQVIKTHCPNDHVLEHPNLVPSMLRRGVRNCLACSRARSYLNRHEELRPQFLDIAQQYYEVIMEGHSDA